MQATIQVLLANGKERLTTTQVALRAGVSVGTLYQYFPNKSALLQAALKRHMDEISQAIQQVCEKYPGAGLLEMCDALVGTYLAAKMRNVKVSVALYSVGSDVEGAAIAKATGNRVLREVAALVATAREGLKKDPEVVASIIFSVLNGISRRVLEARSPERTMEMLREELTILLHTYLRTCTAD